MKPTPTALCAALILALSASANDARTYRKLTLENGLRVVLTSDPDVNVASASMAVGIGANADPEGAAGLAHFLEHMLFLSTEKYPELNGYSDFLQARGGFSNAYTAADHTNYHFEVQNEALPEALDRFAQFFVSPTLDYAHAQREMMAVNSEHQKNVMDDTWRLMQLQRSHLREGHPANSFSTGNKDTLAETKQETLRGFFDSYYQASNMALAVIGKQPLDTLEQLVRERFAGVPNQEPKPWTAPADLLEDSDGLRLLKVVPIKDMRELRIYFEVPDQRPTALQKLGNLVGMTMGDEGEGSLLLYLKNLGLATSLSAGVQETRYYSACQVTVGLTPKGLEQWRQVLQLCFAYTRMLQTTEFPRHVWEELRTLSQLQDRYGAKPEGTQAAIDLANQALEYGLEHAETFATTFEEPDPKAYKALVDALQPKNALVFLVAKGLETDKQETFYGTEYAYSVEAPEAVEALTTGEIPAELHVPPPNPFVPKDVSLVPEQPVLIQEDAGVTLYYHQDTEFQRPKVTLVLHVLSPEAYGSAEKAALTSLYAATINEQLNALSYPALVAGLATSLGATNQGLQLTISGYSESAFKMLELVTKALTADLDAEAFALVHERSVQGLKNFPLGQAYTVAQQLNRELTHQFYVTPEEQLAAVQAATLDQVRAHKQKLFAATHIEGLCAGNLTAEAAKGAVKTFREALGSKPFPAEKAYEDAILVLEEPGDVVLKQVGVTNNACLRLDYQVGAGDVETRMAAGVLARAVQNAFYTEMRTKQKLGYIVFSGEYNRKNVENLVFIIQSGTHDATDLLARATACIDGFGELVAGLPDEAFEAIRQSLIEDRKKAPKTIAQKAGELYFGAFEKERDFGWQQREIEVLEALTKEQVVALTKRTVNAETRKRVVVLLNAEQQGEFAEPGTVTDWDAYREGHTFSAEPAGK